MMTMAAKPSASSASLPGPAEGTPFASAEEYSSQPGYGLDKDGILYRDYAGDYGGLGRWRNPLFISHYAQSLYRDFLKSGDESKKRAFLKQVDYLRSALQDRGDFSVWVYPMENPYFHAKPGWASGITQGMALTVLVRAAAMTGNKAYAQAASAVLRSFQVETAKGGVRTSMLNGGAFYQEVSQPEGAPGYVLNGHISAVMGVYDYWRVTGDESAHALFEQGVAGVEALLPQFFGPGISWYSLDPRIPASLADYNFQHIYLLLWLYKVTGHTQFVQAGLRCMSYVPHRYVARVNGSTSPSTHGPDQLYLQMNSTYWSSNRFPAEVTLDLGHLTRVRNLRIVSYNRDAAAPRDYSITLDAGTDTEEPALMVVGNTEHIRDHDLGDRLARTLRLRIDRDNGNGNVVLNGFGIDMTPGWEPPMAVCNVEGYSVSGLPSRTVDNDPATGWGVPPGGGWLLVDLGRERELWSLRVLADAAGSDEARTPVPVQTSHDLEKWTPLVTAPGALREPLRVPVAGLSARYLRLEFPPDANPLFIREVSVNDDASLPSRYRTLFDAFDAQVNDGAGYSLKGQDDGLATGALLSWSESYLMRAYAEMYQVTDDTVYLRRLASHVRSVLAARDDRRQRPDYLGRSLAEWGTSRYDPQKRWRAYLVLDAMILQPVLEFVQAAQRDGGREFASLAESALQDAAATVDAWDTDWHATADGGYYAWPSVYDEKPGLPLPLDMQAAAGRCHILLARLTGRAEQRDRAARLVNLAMQSLASAANGTLVWGVQPEPYSSGPVGDTSHGAIIEDFLLMAHASGFAVSEDTLIALAKTVSACLKAGRLRRFVNGTGEFSSDPVIGQYAGLAPYDRGLDDRITRALCVSVPLEASLPNLKEDMWGPGMLSLTQLAHLAKERVMQFAVEPAAPTPPATAPAVPVTGHLINGDFESSDATDGTLPLGWVRVQSTAATASLVEREDGGTATVVRGDPAGKLWQNLAQPLQTLQAGRRYEVALEVRTYRGTGARINIVVVSKDGAETSLARADFTNREWEHHTLEFRAPAPTDGTVFLYLSTADHRERDAVAAFDNLTVREMPA